jgi:hypothetical protein
MRCRRRSRRCFPSEGQAFQALNAKAAAFQNQFVSLLRGGAGQYVHTEAANASTLAGQARSALSHPLGKINAAAFGSAATGSAATGDATVGPGTYGPGVYADGRVFVDPGCQIAIQPGGSLNVAPGSEVWVFPSADRLPGGIGIGPGSTLNVGSHSLILVEGGKILTNNTFAVGPDVFLNVRNNGAFVAGPPVTIDHSEVSVTANALFKADGPVTISHGNITGPFEEFDQGPPAKPNPLLAINNSIYSSGFFSGFALRAIDTRPLPTRDLVVIRNFP